MITPDERIRNRCKFSGMTGMGLPNESVNASRINVACHLFFSLPLMGEGWGVNTRRLPSPITGGGIKVSKRCRWRNDIGHRAAVGRDSYLGLMVLQQLPDFVPDPPELGGRTNVAVVPRSGQSILTISAGCRDWQSKQPPGRRERPLLQYCG